jgi:hypothetical protein
MRSRGRKYGGHVVTRSQCGRDERGGCDPHEAKAWGIVSPRKVGEGASEARLRVRMRRGNEVEVGERAVRTRCVCGRGVRLVGSARAKGHHVRLV